MWCDPALTLCLHVIATGGELFVHIKADKNDLCWESAHKFISTLPKAAVKCICETFAWEYKDSRDLSGFIDGTANPTGAVRVKAALIGAEDPQHQGGSYVLGQTWIHDLEKLKAMQLQAQEHAVGRKKENSAKIGDRPADSHVSRMVRISTRQNCTQISFLLHRYFRTSMVLT
jgi:putative iron-dependent peroxidase